MPDEDSMAAGIEDQTRMPPVAIPAFLGGSPNLFDTNTGGQHAAEQVPCVHRQFAAALPALTTI
jgi:hypothetical protein